jgi:malonate transporter MadL subunit
VKFVETIKTVSGKEYAMIIYGTALLAACHLLGIIIGDLLGRALGMTTNVGGVGIAMLLLIIARIYLNRSGLLCATSESGVNYWGAIYIPVVVAMAMQQNVVAALKGGPMALIAAVGTVIVCGLFVSFINRLEPETKAREDAR